jgi:hypothetical protein
MTEAPRHPCTAVGTATGTGGVFLLLNYRLDTKLT